MVREPQSGKYRRTRLFVLTLGYSRKSVRLLVFRSSSQIWAELHEKAFRRLGGATRVVVLDNLREGVLAPDIYDPTLNPLYSDVLALRRHAAALPRRTSGPERQGGERRRPRAEDAAEGSALRDPRRSSGLSGSLGGALGRHADSRHHQTAGRGHVRRRAAGLAAIADRALSLLPIRRAHGASGWLRRSRGGLLQRASGLDRQPRSGAVGCPHVRLLDPLTGQLLREHLRQQRGRHRIKTKIVPTNTLRAPAAAARAEKPDRTSVRCARPCIANRARSRCAASWACSRWPKSMASLPPMRPAPQPGNRRERISLRAPLPGAQSATAAESAAGRSAHPPAHAYRDLIESRTQNPKQENPT
jgi:hypothetical protein